MVDRFSMPLSRSAATTLVGASVLYQARSFARNREIFRAGELRDGVYFLLEGWACRCTILSDGTRAITRLLLPGDFIGLQSVYAERHSSSIVSLSACRLGLCARSNFVENIKSSDDELANVFCLLAEQEQAVESHMAAVCRLPSVRRIAWLARHLLERGAQAGLSDGTSLAMPLTQSDIADALGMSVVHTNKSIAKLQQANVLNWSRSHLTVLNQERLDSYVGLPI